MTRFAQSFTYPGNATAATRGITRLRLLVATCCLVSAGWAVQPCAAQTDTLPPSTRITTQCATIRQSAHDLIIAVKAQTDDFERTNARELQELASDEESDCMAVGDLLHVYELVTTDPARKEVGAYVALRLQAYASMADPRLTEATGMMSLTQVPGLARMAEQLIGQLRGLQKLIATFEPR